MRKFICVALFVSLVSLMGFTQETPKPEVFGGYQYTRFDGGTNASGFNGQATMYINKWLGVSGDFGGAFPSGGKFHASATDPLSGTTVGANGLAMMPGGGVDMGSKQLAFRLVQFDWLISRFSGVTDKNNARISSGLLFRF